ncbi:histidine-type phosphatase, partial [Escherichia sp. TWPC-MK]
GVNAAMIKSNNGVAPHPPQKQAYGVTLPTSVLFIAGHDTNLANLGGALELNWTLPGQPDNTPPGGELVFERWRRLSDNSQWIQVSLVFQTLQLMRDRMRQLLEWANDHYDLVIVDTP